MLAIFMFVDSALFTGPASFSNRSLRGGEGRGGEGRGGSEREVGGSREVMEYTEEREGVREGTHGVHTCRHT